MFYVLSLKDGSVFKRRKLFYNPKVIEKNVQGGLSFNVIESAVYKRRVNFARIGDICSNLKSRLLLPNNIVRPKDFKEIDCTNFKKLILFNSAYEQIRKTLNSGERISMCIVDNNAATACKLSLFVPLISDLSIKTQRRDIYSPYIDKALDEYGAKVRFSDKADADIVLNLDGEECRGKLNLSFESMLIDEKINLAYCYFTLCPENTDRLQFANCLYNFSKVSSLDCVRFLNLKPIKMP